MSFTSPSKETSIHTLTQDDVNDIIEDTVIEALSPHYAAAQRMSDSPYDTLRAFVRQVYDATANCELYEETS